MGTRVVKKRDELSPDRKAVLGKSIEAVKASWKRLALCVKNDNVLKERLVGESRQKGPSRLVRTRT